MKLKDFLHITDLMLDVEIYVEVPVGGDICSALLVKGSIGDVLASGRFSEAIIEFISCDENNVIQIIVSMDSN